MTPPIIEDRLAAVRDLTLSHGCHKPPDHDADIEACLLEAAAWVAGEDWSDSPDCASPIIAAFLRTWNDDLDDSARQSLKKYIVTVHGTLAAGPLIGSRGTPEQEDARAWMAVDWLVRVYTPVWLRAAALDAHADRLEALPTIRDELGIAAMRPVLAAARTAVWTAAMAVAGDAAAWTAAGHAAGAAAGDAAMTAAGHAARAATAAAAVAAMTAARAAAGDAMAAAVAAAEDVLRPHVEALQVSAHQLVERMLAVKALDPVDSMTGTHMVGEAR